MILVDLKDGACTACGGQMMVTGADDATMDVECTECGDCHTVEPDFFRDGGIARHGVDRLFSRYRCPAEAQSFRWFFFRRVALNSVRYLFEPAESVTRIVENWSRR